MENILKIAHEKNLVSQMMVSNGEFYFHWKQKQKSKSNKINYHFNVEAKADSVTSALATVWTPWNQIFPPQCRCFYLTFWPIFFKWNFFLQLYACFLCLDLFLFS